ncbi:MAG: hypothetical protein ACREHD_03175, partial [Pirellulales bacterium]
MHPAPQGRNPTAQGAALGDDSPITLVALKGRDPVGHTETRVTSLLPSIGTNVGRSSRRAGESHPVGVPGFRSKTTQGSA